MLSDLSKFPPLDDETGFRELMERVNQGSEDAVWELVRRCEGYVHRAVRRLLNDKLRCKFDSMDFVQSVWRSLFRKRDRMKRFEDPRRFVQYLIGMACNKIRTENRHRGTLRYDIGREVPLGPSVPSPEPGPEDVAIARERWEQIVKRMPRRNRRIIELKLQGHSAVEIGEILGMDPHNVRRFLNKLLLSTTR